MTNETRVYSWDSGRPTKPDVDALVKAFPPETIKPGGWKIAWDQFREVVGTRESQYRLYTVAVSWRKKMLSEHNIVIWCAKGIGFYCPTFADGASRTGERQAHNIRVMLRHARQLSTMQPTSEMERTVKEHQLRIMDASIRAMRKDKMNLLPPTIAQQPPAISPPKHTKTS